MRFFKFSVCSVVFPLLLSAAACAPHTVALAPQGEHSINVTGQGEVFAAPDVGRVRLGVEERAMTAEEAMQRANGRMSAITEALRAQGIEARDLQTTELSVYFERTQEPPIYIPPRADLGEAGTKSATTSAPIVADKPEGFYVVRNTLIVSVRKLDQLGAVIGSAMSAGANQLYGFELTIDDASGLRDQARKKAVQQAVSKAKLLADEADIKLGPVISVTELDSGEAAPMMADRAMMANKSSVPVETGELSLTQRVQVTFAIER